ncbi:MAG: DUF3179 domain-containing (seleno)protein [Acidimicrobiia bacterium]
MAVAVMLAACGAQGGGLSSTTRDPSTTFPLASGPTGASGYVFPPALATRSGGLDTVVAEAVDTLAGTSLLAGIDFDALDTVVASGDARLGWVLADLLRFLQIGRDAEGLIEGFEALTGVSLPAGSELHPWRTVTDHLIAWDLAAPPGYERMKQVMFLQVEPAWEPFFDDDQADVDWRLVSWGGVLMDDRPSGDTRPCPRGCIPALDDPTLTDAARGDWFPDSGIVFGVVINGEAVAFPKNIMEVHEMVNITVGGRRLGIPYCTLCGSAQAYYLDENPQWSQEIVLRTSGLLSRSNKMMYELGTFSLVDTFTGVATSGPLRDAGVVLEQTTVVASLWGDWKQAHPDTRIVAEDGGLGRRYPSDPLGGRDDAGPIFPIGDVDHRLPVQTEVIGVIAPDGAPIAFPVQTARTAAGSAVPITLGGVTMRRDGSGFRAYSDSGEELVAHQAFWFAWSQFHPNTLIWD